MVSVVDVIDRTKRCAAPPCPGPIENLPDSLYPVGVGLAERLDYTVLLARYKSDDRAVLAWVDPSGSGSIALDGLALVAVPVRGRDVKQLAKTLVKPTWVRDAPTGTDLLVVKSSGRLVTDEREVQRCDAAGQCRAIVAGGQTMDPAWSLDGRRIAYVRTDASRDPAAFPRSHFPSGVQSGWPARYATRHLWIADADGANAHEVAGVGDGVAVLEWSDVNHVIAVVDGRLREIDVATGRSVVLSGELGPSGALGPPDAAQEPVGWEGFVALAP